MTVQFIVGMFNEIFKCVLMLHLLQAKSHLSLEKLRKVAGIMPTANHLVKQSKWKDV